MQKSIKPEMSAAPLETGGRTTRRVFDLEQRTFEFAGRVRRFVKRLRLGVSNIDDARQVVRSSGSIGANYIEANEALSRKDFAMRLRIARKEAKETRYWLRLMDVGDDVELLGERDTLAQESHELMCILAAILREAQTTAESPDDVGGR